MTNMRYGGVVAWAFKAQRGRGSRAFRATEGMDKPTKLTNKPNQTGQTTPISNKPTETKPNQTAWVFKAQ